MNIGFFDSGIGGVSIARAVSRRLPQYSYVYYADDLHMPYGSKHAQTLYELTTRALRAMFTTHNCALVILACNTATTVLPRIQQEWLPVHFPDRKVLGVIRPTVEHMVEQGGANPIYVLATAQTVRAQSYDHELAKIGKQCDFHEIPCPLLASAIEYSSDIEKDQYITQLLERYLRPIPKNAPVTIYTGCTHFEFVSEFIKKLHPHAVMRTQSAIIAEKCIHYLTHHSKVENKLSVKQKPLINVACSSGEGTYTKKVHSLLGFS